MPTDTRSRTTTVIKPAAGQGPRATTAKPAPRRRPPVISVITVCLNAADTLERTLRSVQEQTYPHVEHIVIDGGSTDGTVDILQHHSNHIAHWTSEPDGGISDAMNKGAAAATGDYLIFINADDRLADAQALARAAARVAQQPGSDFYAFCINFGDDRAFETRCSRAFNSRMRFKTGIFHQGVLCSADAHRRLNGFDVRYSHALDYDYFLRAYVAGMRLSVIPDTIAFMSEGGLSTGSDWPSVRKRLEQERAIQMANADNGFWPIIYRAYWSAYSPFKWLKHRNCPTDNAILAPCKKSEI